METSGRLDSLEKNFRDGSARLLEWVTGSRIGRWMCAALVLAWCAAELHHSDSWSILLRGSVIGVVLYLMAVVKWSLETEKELARTDCLTGVANRRAFLEAVTHEINRARRYRRPFTIAYLDLDDFKEVNDRFGHHAGDALLRLVAQTIQENIRTTDLVARLGGDELAVLLPETGFESAELVVRRLRRCLYEAVCQKEWSVTSSFGVITCEIPPDTAQQVVQVADELMYWVKRNGKNGIRQDVLANTLVS